MLGYKLCYEEIMPPEVSEYPIVPMYADYSDSKYKYGEVHHLKDPQRFLNKMFNETVRSAQAMSSGKVLLRKNEIPNGNIDEFMDNWNKPTANAKSETPPVKAKAAPKKKKAWYKKK